MTDRPRWTPVLGAGYLAVTLAMTQSMVNLGALGSSVYLGDARLIVWTLAWANHAVLDGVPLFDANIYYPAAPSLQFNEHLTGLSLFTLPVYALTRNPILGYNLIWILSFILNALATHALAWRHTRSHPAAATAALVFTFASYKMLHAHGHLAHIWTWLVPISLWLLERWIEKPSIGRAGAWAAAIVMQALGSWYVAVMIVLVNGIALAWSLALTVRDRWLVRFRQLAIVTACGAAIVVPFARHYRGLQPASAGEAATFSVDWRAYVVPPEDTWMGQWWIAHLGPGPASIWGERAVFLGWIAVALAAIGAAVLLGRREWRRAGMALSCVVIGVFLSFGPSFPDGVEGHSPFGWFSSIPGMPGFRAPARFALVALFGVALLAADGARTALDRLGRYSVAAALLIWPLMLAEWFIPVMPGGRPAVVQIPEIYRSEPLRTARAIVSLPAYENSPEWWQGGDYLLYSTLYWRPIVNGFGRTEPPGHRRNISYMRAFPGPNNARRMREIGVEYVVLHGSHYPDKVADLLREAQETGEYDLVRQVGSDYLFRVRSKTDR